MKAREFFLDSGAHSIYNRVIKAGGQADGYRTTDPEELARRYAYYRSKDFKAYLDEYAAFLKKYRVRNYVNVDAIHHPEYSWRTLKYLERKHGLKPLPVIHFGTPIEWVHRHLDEGYTFIGLGGLGQDSTKQAYIAWADQVFTVLCDSSGIPKVKIHGFAMTSWELMNRYPWWSVDSASWVKYAAYGMIVIPRKKDGKFDGKVKPFACAISDSSPRNIDKSASDFEIGGASDFKLGLHYSKLTVGERKHIREWLEFIDIPFGSCNPDGSVKEWGVCSHLDARSKAVLHFFELIKKSLPEWPWKFQRMVNRKGFDL